MFMGHGPLYADITDLDPLQRGALDLSLSLVSFLYCPGGFYNLDIVIINSLFTLLLDTLLI